MNLSELNKDQKQGMLLAVMGVATVLFVTVNLIYKPAKARREKLEKQYEAIKDNTRGAQRVLAKDRQDQELLRQSSSSILTIQQEMLPPRRSTFAWVLGRVDKLGKELGLSVQIDLQSRQRYLPVPSGTDYNSVRYTLPMWIPYTVRVTTECSYADAIEFLAKLQTVYPYASISRLQISTGRQPEAHRVSFDVEWPTFREASDLKELQKLAGEPS